MIRSNSLSVIAAAVFAALSTAAVAQTQQRQATDASQAAQTNPTQEVSPSAATGVQSNVEASGNNSNIRMNSSATTNLDAMALDVVYAPSGWTPQNTCSFSCLSCGNARCPVITMSQSGQSPAAAALVVTGPADRQRRGVAGRVGFSQHDLAVDRGGGELRGLAGRVVAEQRAEP